MRSRKRHTGRMVSIDEDVEPKKAPCRAIWRTGVRTRRRCTGSRRWPTFCRKTIQGLPPGFRVVFVLRDVEGLSTEETAETLGLSIPAVKSRLLRARWPFRERLSRYFKRRDSKQAQGGAK